MPYANGDYVNGEWTEPTNDAEYFADEMLRAENAGSTLTVDMLEAHRWCVFSDHMDDGTSQCRLFFVPDHDVSRATLVEEFTYENGTDDALYRCLKRLAEHYREQWNLDAAAAYAKYGGEQAHI